MKLYDNNPYSDEMESKINILEEIIKKEDLQLNVKNSLNQIHSLLVDLVDYYNLKEEESNYE